MFTWKRYLTVGNKVNDQSFAKMYDIPVMTLSS